MNTEVRGRRRPFDSLAGPRLFCRSSSRRCPVTLRGFGSGLALAALTAGGSTAFAQALPDAKVKALEGSIDRALAAYNKQDARAFYAEWTSAFRLDKLTDYYADALKDYGTYVSRKMIKDDSFVEGEAPLFVYEAKFSKAPRVKVSVHFTKDGEATRIINIEMEKM
jgi:hypothetical protein